MNLNQKTMKKIYNTPTIACNAVLPQSFCAIQIKGSTTETSGNLGKSREELIDEEEMDEAMIMLLKDHEENNSSDLW